MQILFERPRGRAPDNLTRADDLRRKDAAARSQNRSRLDASLIADADLSANDSVILDDHSARESCLRGNDHVPANAAVVADVDHVVELCALPQWL